VRRQSDHFAAYRAALDRLIAMGLVYPSFESRAEIARLVAARERAGAWPRDPDGVPLYPGTAKALSADERRERMAREPYALRLDMAAAMARTGTLDWRETGRGPEGETGRVPAAPAQWGDVVRGEDLFRATSVHRVLQALLDLPAPTYHHHRLIRDAAGRKLAKSTHATGLRELRAQGLTPAAIRTLIGLV
jgi:glutamyl-Q tRNA(Asp) synthetase